MPITKNTKEKTNNMVESIRPPQVTDAKQAPELSKIRQDSESLPSYFLRGYDCEHKRLSPDGDCLDCGS